MPFYVADYLADTGDLRTVDHGAYLLLIMQYWRNGHLPDDDRKLAKITRLPLKAWCESVRPNIEHLFHNGWHHKRIDAELAKQEVIATKRAIAGQRGGMMSAIARTNDKTVRLSKHVRREAIAKQMGGNHSHIANSSLRGESERAEPPRATEEERKTKPPHETTRAELDEIFEQKRIAAGRTT